MQIDKEIYVKCNAAMNIGKINTENKPWKGIYNEGKLNNKYYEYRERRPY